MFYLSEKFIFDMFNDIVVFSVCEDTDSSQRGEGCSMVKEGVLFCWLLASSCYMVGNQGIILGIQGRYTVTMS